MSERSTAAVRTVTIKSMWGGLSPSPPPPIELLIHGHGDKVFDSDGTPVSANLIELLVQALAAPALDWVQSSNLGITRKWLEDNAENATRRSLLGSMSRSFWRTATHGPQSQALSTSS